MNPYPSYKGSGIEWIEEIPKHWVNKKFKYLFDQKKEQISNDDLDEKQLVHYSIPNVQSYYRGVVESGSDIQSNKFLITGGELIISKLNPRQKTICITEKEEILSVCSTEFIVLR